MLDPNKIRLRVRHFLLQQSVHFERIVSKDFKGTLPISSIARELSRKVDIPARRLQRYLAKELGPKEVSITLTDLELIAGMKNIPLSHFIAYLLEEEVPADHSGWRKGVIDFVQSLHEGHRRALGATVFSGKNQQKSEKIVELMIHLYSLNDKDINAVESIVDAFSVRQKQ
jgi:hypothetical protein